MKQIVVYGAGGFGREIVWLAECCKDCKVMAVVDDDPKWQGRSMNGIPVMGFDKARANFPDCAVVVAVGTPSVREKITEKVKRAGVKIADLIHPDTQMSRWVDMDQGVVICAGCILTTNIQLKKHVQINLDCTIGHDVVMGDYTTLAPGVHVSGWVHFGKRVYVGTGAVFINGTEEKPLIVGDDTVIGAGAVVTRSVPPCETWGGYRQDSLVSGHEPVNDVSNVSEDRFSNWQYPEIQEGKPTKYNWVVQNIDGFKLGYKTDIGAFSYFNAKYGVTIGNFVQIGSHCSIYSISTIDDKQGSVVLEENCRIGSHSVIMPGVTVGQNAVVGAFSFVNQDVHAGQVVVGVPAKPIGR